MVDGAIASVRLSRRDDLTRLDDASLGAMHHPVATGVTRRERRAFTTPYATFACSTRDSTSTPSTVGCPSTRRSSSFQSTTSSQPREAALRLQSRNNSMQAWSTWCSLATSRCSAVFGGTLSNVRAMAGTFRKVAEPCKVTCISSFLSACSRTSTFRREECSARRNNDKPKADQHTGQQVGRHDREGGRQRDRGRSTAIGHQLLDLLDLDHLHARVDQDTGQTRDRRHPQQPRQQHDEDQQPAAV